MREPLWRIVLCWGTVVTFLTLPLVVFVLHIVSDEVTWLHFSQHVTEYKFMIPFFQTITALVFGLAGLHSWDKRINGKGRSDGDGERAGVTKEKEKEK